MSKQPNYLPGSVRQYDANFCEIDDTDNIIIDCVKELCAK